MYTPTEVELDNLGLDPNQFGGKEVPKAEGCAECSFTGYVGRSVTHELLIIDDEVRTHIMERADAATIKRTAKKSQNFETLRDDGIQKVIDGVTTPVELVSITQDE